MTMKYLGRLEDLAPITFETRIEGCFGCGEKIGTTLLCPFCLTARTAAADERERCARIADVDMAWGTASRIREGGR